MAEITPHLSVFLFKSRPTPLPAQNDNGRSGANLIKRKTLLANEHKAPSFKGFHCLGGQDPLPLSPGKQSPDWIQE